MVPEKSRRFRYERLIVYVEGSRCLDWICLTWWHFKLLQCIHAPAAVSINIGGPDHDNFHSVLFHFNPRHYERGGQLVLNNKKEGMWGQAINVPLSTIPIIFGQPACTLVIQINGDGFDTFLNEKHIARLEHRRELASGRNSLFLNFPATDDYNKVRPSLLFVDLCRINLTCSSIFFPNAFSPKVGLCTR